jgi:UBX domain-containing protein 1/4
MTLIECGSPTVLSDFIRSKAAVVVTFSAHWCGPCRASKPALEALAGRMQSKLPMGIVYEDVLGDAIHHTYHVRAFPTHVLFVSGIESQRVEGANIPAIEAMMETYLATAPPPSFETAGETLGGGLTNLSPAEARLARLAKLSAFTAAVEPTSELPNDAVKAAKERANASLMEEDDDKVEDIQPEKKMEHETTDGDVEMEDAKDDAQAEEVEEVDPAAKLNPNFIQTLTETMGFSVIRAQKGLLYGTGGTIEGAVEWLMEHQDDADIDAPIAKETRTVQSYKCNECGRILSNMANLELHANKTGHSDFEESTESIKPMTEEEKVAKIAEIKVRVQHLLFLRSLSFRDSHVSHSFVVELILSFPATLET